MTITISRDVVNDLLPIYAAGEASADSRALVEAYLRTDPGLASALAALKEDALPATVPPPARQSELVGVERTKDLLRQRTGFLVAAVVCTSLPFSFGFWDGAIRFFMIRDAPAVALPFLVCGLSFWIAFVLTVRRLRVRGL